MSDVVIVTVIAVVSGSFFVYVFDDQAAFGVGLEEGFRGRGGAGGGGGRGGGVLATCEVAGCGHGKEVQRVVAWGVIALILFLAYLHFKMLNYYY